MQLVEAKMQGPWLATFVKGQGYTSFPETLVHDAVDLPTAPAQ
jgi:acyl carrier protein phosphodiesterase